MKTNVANPIINILFEDVICHQITSMYVDFGDGLELGVAH
jgi:hypothetical protein